MRDRSSNSCKVKTNLCTLKFDDEEKKEIFLAIISEIEVKGNVSLETIKSKLRGRKIRESKILNVLNILYGHNLLSQKLSDELKMDFKNNYNQSSLNFGQVENTVLTIFG